MYFLSGRSVTLKYNFRKF